MITQIYEIQTSDEAEAMIRLGVDHIGTVILTTDQCHNSALKAAVEKAQAAGRKSSVIPLFCDLEAVLEMVDYYRPDILHLCESLPPPGSSGFQAVLDRQRSIRRHFPKLSIMRSIPIGIPGFSGSIPSLIWAAALEPVSDWFLTDTLLTAGYPDIESTGNADQPVPGFIGITGQTCDWQVARALVQTSRIPVILAGGIGPDNVGRGIQVVRPAGVDSCTLTNATDGKGGTIRFKKDTSRVGNLIRTVRLSQL